VTIRKPSMSREDHRDIAKSRYDDSRLSIHHYRAIVDSGPIGIIIVNLQGEIDYANAKAEQIFGYERGELSGKSIEVLLPPEQREAHLYWREVFHKAPQQRPMGQGREFYALRKDGSRVPVEVGLDYFSEGGEKAFISYVVDISRRRELEKTLKETESRLRRLLDNSKEAIFEVSITGEVLYASPACRHIFGYEPDVFLQEPDFAARIVHPHSRQQFKDFWRHYRNTGIFPDTPSQWAWIHKDGHVVYTENSFTNLFDAQGNLTGFQTIAREITDRVLAQEALRHSEENLRSTLQSLDNLVFVLDENGVFLDYHKPKGYELLITPEEFLHKSFKEVLPASLVVPLDEAIQRLVATGTTQEFDYSLEIDGETRWFRAKISARRDSLQKFAGVTIVAQDITKLRDTERHMEYLATHDTLTGLPNRTLINDRLAHAIEQAARNGMQVAVMFLDLDRFKLVNDTLGHAKGDLLLQEAAERLSECLRQSDTIGRLGGDEFIIVLENVRVAKDAVIVAQKILNAFSVPFVIEERQFYITISVGISMYPNDGEDEQTLIKNADLAMYRAKEQGRNYYQFYDPAMNIRALKRLIMESSLRYALQRDEFVLHYQPKINTQTGEIAGIEALLRWEHPELGLLLPAQFISLAEETGLIIPISEWVLRTACAQNRVWVDSGYPPLRISVNISNRQFQVPNLAASIEAILNETGMPPYLLELEISEPTTIQDTEKAILELNALKEMGVHIALDDFGTRYSSLNYLKRFPIDTIKIDQSFVYDVDIDPDDAAIASAIIVMAHNLGLDVVAEGVENQSQLAFLRQRKCDAIQGHVFSRALPVAEMTDLLKRTASS